MKYFDDAPTLFYKLQEVKEALSKIEKVSFKSNDFMINESEEFEHDIRVFKNKIGAIRLTITKPKDNDAPLLFYYGIKPLSNSL